MDALTAALEPVHGSQTFPACGLSQRRYARRLLDNPRLLDHLCSHQALVALRLARGGGYQGLSTNLEEHLPLMAGLPIKMVMINFQVILPERVFLEMTCFWLSYHNEDHDITRLAWGTSRQEPHMLIICWETQLSHPSIRGQINVVSVNSSLGCKADGDPHGFWCCLVVMRMLK